MRYYLNILFSFIPTLYSRNEKGATMVEYAVLVALISVAAIVIIAAVGTEVNDAFTEVRDCIQDPTACGN